MYDITIVGAGPAGATLARLLGDRARVLLLDSRPFASAPSGGLCDKCCGGLLAPDAQAMLGRLGLGLPQEVLVDPQLFVVRAIDLPTGLERHYQRFYLNLDRERFDRWLLSLLPAAVDVRTGCRFTGAEETADGLRLRFVSGGRAYFETTRWLIGADGAWSTVRRRMLPHLPTPRRYFAIQAWCETEQPLPHFSVFFDPAITDYYAWAIPKAGSLLLGVPVRAGEEPHGALVQLRQRIATYGFRLGRTVQTKGAFLLRPCRAGRIAAGAGRIALIGEAGGWISPSSGEGLSYALGSALTFAESFEADAHQPVQAYARAVRGMRRTLRRKMWKSPFLYRPILRRLILRWGVSCLPVSTTSLSAPAGV